jgi:5-methylcytosine-specific restriction enzyme subunit McrC
MKRGTRLVLREGGEYTRQELEAQSDAQAAAGSEETDNVAETWFYELVNLKLAKASTVMFTRNGEGIRSEDADDDPSFESEDLSDGLRYLMRLTRRGSLVVGHLVGAANLPCGVTLEVLPKIRVHNNDDRRDRASFRRMWEYAADLNLREHDQTAGVVDAQLPLHEWLVHRFLDQVDSLVLRGIRLHYVEREDNLSTVRGRLLVAQNLRTNALAPHRFFCRFEDFSADRPENRLIRSAVRRVMGSSSNPENQRRAAQLNERLQEIPLSQNIAQDFSRWRDDRLMAHYREIRSSCRWILNSRGAAPVAGDDAMFGCFVRMNDVFERYVVRWMQNRLIGTDYELLDQNSGLSDARRTKQFCSWDGKPRSMRPDILIYSRMERHRCVAILDAKWKRTVDMEAGSDRPSAGSDLYQMYAYAQHWLAEDAGTKIIALVYPSDKSNTPVNTSTQRFLYDRINNVQGYALRFRMPSLEMDEGWVEGLDDDHGSDLLRNFVNDIPN